MEDDEHLALCERYARLRDSARTAEDKAAMHALARSVYARFHRLTDREDAAFTPPEESDEISGLLLVRYGVDISSNVAPLRYLAFVAAGGAAPAEQMARDYVFALLSGVPHMDYFVKPAVWLRIVRRMFENRPAEKKGAGGTGARSAGRSGHKRMAEAFDKWAASTYGPKAAGWSRVVFMAMAVRRRETRDTLVDMCCREYGLDAKDVRGRLLDAGSPTAVTAMLHRDHQVDYNADAVSILDTPCPGAGPAALDVVAHYKWFAETLHNQVLAGMRAAAARRRSFVPLMERLLPSEVPSPPIDEWLAARGLPLVSRHATVVSADEEEEEAEGKQREAVSTRHSRGRRMFSEDEIRTSQMELYQMIAQRQLRVPEYADPATQRMVVLCSQLPNAAALVHTVMPSIDPADVATCHWMRESEWIAFVCASVRTVISDKAHPPSMRLQRILDPDTAVAPAEALRRHLFALRDFAAYASRHGVIDPDRSRQAAAQRLLEAEGMPATHADLRIFREGCIVK